MQRLTYYVASTLDGFIARDDGQFDFFLDAPDVAQRYLTELRAFDVALLGRRTWEVGLRFGVTNPYPWLETHVVSASLERLPDPALHLVRGDVLEHVRALKQRGGRGIYLCGGGALASQLFDAGLVDDVVLKLHPLLLGSGIPLAPRLARLVRLSSVRPPELDPTGVMVLRASVA